MTARRPSIQRYPALYLATALAIGILVGSCTNVGVWPPLFASMATAVLALVLRSQLSGTVFICFAFIAAGVVLNDAERMRASAPDRLRVIYDTGVISSWTPVGIEGVVQGAPEASLNGEFVNISGDKLWHRGGEQRVSGTVRIFVPTSRSGDVGNEISLAYGARIRVTCALEREDEFLNPGVQLRRDILDRMGVDATCTVKSPMLVEHIADESVFLPLARVYAQRAKLVEDLHEHLSPRAAGVMIASLLGNKYYLDKDTADLFREGGTFHILVISGLHITFIGGLLLLLVRRMTRNRWLEFAVTAGVLWAYTLAVGADTPVVRATVMFTILLLGHAVYRQGQLLNSLGVCALVLLVWRPSELFDPSFQLTFVSVGAIVGCAYPLIEKLRNIGAWTPTPDAPFPPTAPPWLVSFSEMLYWNDHSWAYEQKRNVWTGNIHKAPLLGGRLREWSRDIIRYLIEGIIVSAIVQIWMLPLSVWYFHRVSFAGVLLNLWVGVWVAVESFAAVMGILLGNFSDLLSAGFYAIADAMNWVLLLLPRLFSDNGWASFRSPAYHGAAAFVYLAYFVPLLVLAWVIARWDPFKVISARDASTRHRRIELACAAAVCVLIVIIAAHPLSAPSADGRLHVDFLDVGQGDSALLTFPNGETLLVDGGGRQEYNRDVNGDSEGGNFRPDTRTIGESVVSEVLWFKGYSRVDHILATHADADHIQGLNDVAKNFTIGNVMFGRTPLSNGNFAQLNALLDGRHIPVMTITRGDTFQLGGATVEVLNPSPAAPDAPSDNDHSVVLRITYGTRTFLMTGDIEHSAEADMIVNNEPLAADIVKVPHHGSRTSSTAEFVSAAHPQFAVISVGGRSPFGHPHPDVVERWRDAGVRVLTTGENGMISASTDGSDLQMSRYLP